LKNLCPAWPLADRSRCLEDCPGGGGKAGDMGICGLPLDGDVNVLAELDGTTAEGEVVNPICSTIGDGRTPRG